MTTAPISPARGVDNGNWGGDNIGYAGAHHRIQRVRGSARQHQCVVCEGPAATWAYDGKDLDQKIGEKNGCVVAYSTDPAHYQPMCRPCHQRYDAPPACPAGHTEFKVGRRGNGALFRVCVICSAEAKRRSARKAIA